MQLFLLYLFNQIKVALKWSDIRPSMVTHTQNLCSAFIPSKCTHTAVNKHTHTHTHTHKYTHTLWKHIRSSGQPFMLWGSSWGFSALLKGTSVMVLRVERVLDLHSPDLQFLPARDSNSQPFDYESDSLNIRSWLPPIIIGETALKNMKQIIIIPNF